MAETEEGTAGKEFTIDTPLVKGSIKGYHIGNLLQIIAAVLLALMGYVLYTHSVETSPRRSAAASEHTAILEQGKDIKQVIQDAQEEHSYILTLSPEERKALNLDAPRSLRSRMRDDGTGRDRDRDRDRHKGKQK